MQQNQCRSSHLFQSLWVFFGANCPGDVDTQWSVVASFDLHAPVTMPDPIFVFLSVIAFLVGESQIRER